MLINNFKDFEAFLINQINSRKELIYNILPNNAGEHVHDFNKGTETHSNRFLVKILKDFGDWKAKNINKPFSDYIFEFLYPNIIDNKKIDDIKDFEYLLKNLDLNIKDNNGLTPLQLASSHNNINMVKILLCEGNFDMNIENDNKIISSLYFAVRNSNIDMVELLISYGINISNNLGILQVAITENNIVMTKWLLENGADINYTSTMDSPLHRAIVHNYVDIVKLLLEYNPDLNIKGNEYHMTSLSLAISLKHQEIYQELKNYKSKQNSNVANVEALSLKKEEINFIDLQNQPLISGIRPSSSKM